MNGLVVGLPVFLPRQPVLPFQIPDQVGLAEVPLWTAPNTMMGLYYLNRTSLVTFVFQPGIKYPCIIIIFFLQSWTNRLLNP